MVLKDFYGDLNTYEDFINSYTNTFEECIKNIDSEIIKKVVSILEIASQKKNRIFSIGNGGSSAISDHLCCDFTKGTSIQSIPDLSTYSLGCNSALTTAISNDIGYDYVFSQQIKYHGSKGDILIAISSSGNSKNIVNAIEKAKELEMIVIGLCGFSGGKMIKLVDYCLHTPAYNYGIVEDCHQALMHIIAQILRMRREKLITW